MKLKSYLPVLIYLRDYLFSESFKLRHRDSATSFSRSRKFNFATLVVSQIIGLTKTLSVEIASIFKWQAPNDLTQDATKQAYSKYRKNLKHSAYIELNRVLLHKIYAEYPVQCYKKNYILGMIDGTSLELPNEPALISHFGLMTGGAADFTGRLCAAKGSVCYDVLNHLSWDMSITPYGSCERKLAGEHLSQLHTAPAPGLAPLVDSLRQHNRLVLLLMDRGYPGWDLFMRFRLQNVGFVCRVAHNFCSDMVDFAATDAVDLLVKIDLSTVSRRQALSNLRKSNPDMTTELHLRFIKIVLSTGETEYLITDRCDQLEFLYEDFNTLYGLRWGGETQYNYLKNTMEIENFSGKLVNTILQDAFARQLSFNICQMMLTEAEGLLHANPPKTDTNPPKADVNPPKADTNPPKADVNLQKADTNPPKADVNLPKADTNPPKADTNPPKADVNPPKADTNPPKADTNPPKADTNPPKADVNLPKADTNPPKADVNPPKAEKTKKNG